MQMTFYKEWLPLDKKDFRILAMLADLGEFRGNLSDMCRYFSLDTQSRNKNQLRTSIQKLTELNYIETKQCGRTYILKIVPKEEKIEMPRRWIEPIMRHEYTSQSVAWEQVIKVFIWITQNNFPVVQNEMIEKDLKLSVSQIGAAKNVLSNDFAAIIREIEKVEVGDIKYNVGQRLAAVADWSDT